MNNSHDLMKKYSDIVSGSKINESIEDGILNVVDQRLSKTIGMIEDLISNIREEAPETVFALEELLGKLQIAREDITPIKATFDDMEIPMDYDEVETDGALDLGL